MIHHVQTWLKQKPRKSEIVEIQNGKDKVKIIPQKIIESLLDELTEQNWSTRNFQFNRVSQKVQITNPKVPQGTGFVYDVVDKVMCDASLELVVTYRIMVAGPLDTTSALMVEKEITRVLVGAYSFDISLFGNDHIANTAKSLAIANAASDLGNRFGKSLNPKEAAMMIVGMKPPVFIPENVSDEVKNKISDTLSKLTNDLKNKK